MDPFMVFIAFPPYLLDSCMTFRMCGDGPENKEGKKDVESKDAD